jgi:hypothetical protein
MPQVGFEPMIPVFELAKTVHAFDRAATVIGRSGFIVAEFYASKPYENKSDMFNHLKHNGYFK